jgi:hypothetical protein
VSQRSIEVVVGRLVTDEAFRDAFLRDPQRTLEAVVESGLALTDLEVRAVIGTQAALWSSVADALDPRLQKASLARASSGHPRCEPSPGVGNQD